MERRDFLKASALGVAATTVTTGSEAQNAPPFPAPPTTDEQGMKYRILGETGVRVSLIGIGGFHLAKPDGPTEEEAIRIVRTAIDQGVNFCDNCWDYNG